MIIKVSSKEREREREREKVELEKRWRLLKKSFSSVFATFVAVSFEIIESRGPTKKKKWGDDKKFETFFNFCLRSFVRSSQG